MSVGKRILLLAGVVTALACVGCSSDSNEGAIDPGEIKTAPAGKTNNRPPVGGAPEAEKASAGAGSSQSTD